MFSWVQRYQKHRPSLIITLRFRGPSEQGCQLLPVFKKDIFTPDLIFFHHKMKISAIFNKQFLRFAPITPISTDFWTFNFLRWPKKRLKNAWKNCGARERTSPFSAKRRQIEKMESRNQAKIKIFRHFSWKMQFSDTLIQVLLISWPAELKAGFRFRHKKSCPDSWIKPAPECPLSGS